MHQSGSTLRRFLPLCTTLAKLHSCRNPRLVPSAFTSRCSSSSPVMASQSPPRSEKLVLVLCGKSPSEIELAKLLKDSNALKLNDNHTIAVHLLSQSGKPGDDEKLPFDVDSFMAAISTNRFGRLLIWSPRLPSTHDVVSQNFGELPVGSVCVADVQFKGRGRSKNAWESPTGCLMFSFTIQMEDGRVVPLIQYVVSLAMTEAIKDACNRSVGGYCLCLWNMVGTLELVFSS
ncbi:ATP-dependent 5'-3' DNA helicase hcs1 [Dionaea muscipula]